MADFPLNESMKKVDFQHIMPYSPHRPPMVWIDEVAAYGATDGECVVRVKKDALYMDPDGLRSSACIEFIAQAYGYMSIAFRIYENHPNAKPLKRAFLAAIKDAQTCAPEILRTIQDGDRLNIRISGVRALGPITMFNGEVLRGTQSLATAQMKVFSEFV